MENPQTESTQPRIVIPDTNFGEEFARLSETEKATVRRAAALLVEKASEACDRAALEHPAYVETIRQIKADLSRLPSAGHAASVFRALIDIAEDRYHAPLSSRPGSGHRPCSA